jgi:hypothetical protein
MKTAKQRLFIMAATALALACSASELSVLSSPVAPTSPQSAEDATEPVAPSSFDAWRAASGYPPGAYAPQGSWEAVFRAAPR